MRAITVRDLMTPKVFVAGPDDPVALVRDFMDTKHVRHVPVVDADGTLVGVVSPRDLLRRALADAEGLPLSAQTQFFESVRVRDVVTADIDTVEADEPIAQAAELMVENKYGCSPVLDGGALAGIITEADFVRFVGTSSVEGRRGEAAPQVAPRRPRGVRSPQRAPRWRT
jgi:CBS domain-containing membrane protein